MGCMGPDAKREYFLTIPRHINWDQETFEVLGLLQAEMGKTDNGCVTFANSDSRIINRAMKWFEKELELNYNRWKWYIKVNINEPEEDYKKEIERKVINYWLGKTKISPEARYPKIVSYIKNTKNKKLKNYDYGTLILDCKSNLLSQIVKRYVKLMSDRVPDLGKEEIKWFMGGIIAGEGCVELYKSDKTYRVNISAVRDEERKLYQRCLAILGIDSKLYGDKQIMISKRENNFQLLKQKLMCLNSKKYNKFLNMMKQYPEISEETGYFAGKKKPHNKLSEEKVNEVLRLYCKDSNLPCWKIAELVGVSKISVNRILRKNNLGKRLIQTSELKREEIAEFAKNNLKWSQKQIAKHFEASESVVGRVCKRFGAERGNKARCKIPEEKEKKIIEIYKKDPKIKFSEIREKVRVSDSVIKRVRRNNNLSHLGFKHLVGCNNPNRRAFDRFIK